MVPDAYKTFHLYLTITLVLSSWGFGFLAIGRGRKSAAWPFFLWPVFAFPFAFMTEQIAVWLTPPPEFDLDDSDFNGWDNYCMRMQGVAFIALFCGYLLWERDAAPVRVRRIFLFVAAAFFLIAAIIPAQEVMRRVAIEKRVAAYRARYNEFELAVPPPGDRFESGGRMLQTDDDLGVVNGHVTCGVSSITPGAINGIWAPPFVSSDFSARWRLNGELFETRNSFAWRPQSVSDTWQDKHGFQMNYALWLAPGKRCIVQALQIWSLDGESHELNLALDVLGTLDRVPRWEFARPESKSVAAKTPIPGGLLLQQGETAIAILVKGLTAANASDFEQTLTLDAREPLRVFATYAVADTPTEAQAIGAEALAAAAADSEAFIPRATEVPYELPTLVSDEREIDALFSRSLVHLIMNRWDVPEFKLRPYYSTGSVKGGCLCNYLWNFGEVWEILPLLDPKATKEHIKQFLSCDLTQHFAFDPVSGEGFGQWYMVNQEKIIGLIYFYTLMTGDTAFLHEKVGENTIAELAVEQSLVKDDLAKPVALIDYGPSNSHLELRHEYQYNHVMPDLNGRRYENLVRAAAIAGWAGTPRPELLAHAEELKALLAHTLWDPEAKWFHFVNGEGKPELRYTMQVFKLFNSAVLSTDQVEGLLSHFNEREFFSAQGMHSMSKLDPAYDQVDIDNGGGGACTSFPPQIAERLYKMGRSAPADDILRRITWWGERMPYWGDSIVANEIAYRKDTPLQCTIDGAAVAQCVIFGLFGVAPHEDGTVTICPRKTAMFRAGMLGNITLRDHHFSVKIDGERFSVEEPGEEAKSAALGETITLVARS